MEDLIMQIIVASGAMGFLVNYSVSGIKWLQNNYSIAVTPRTANACISLVTAIMLATLGNEVDMSVIETSITTLSMAFISYIVANFTHKVNKI